MEDIKSNVAKNITELRILNNMTQMELAEKLNYSDKTISKWERAESSPDISVLVEMADLFGVTLDYLVRTENVEEAVSEHKTKEVTFKLDYDSFKMMDILYNMTVEPGLFRILVGAAANDIRLEGEVTI